MREPCLPCVSESFYRFVGPGQLHLFHTSAIFGLRLREFKPRHFVCPSIIKECCGWPKKRIAHITYRCHYITEFACIVLTRQMAV